MKSRTAWILLFCLCTASSVSAQVKSPQDVLGFRFGEDHKLADWSEERLLPLLCSSDSSQR